MVHQFFSRNGTKSVKFIQDLKMEESKKAKFNLDYYILAIPNGVSGTSQITVIGYLGSGKEWHEKWWVILIFTMVCLFCT
mmetsp:Transcript_12985/g.11490  ORF Transcript_12985/g.11490 Transcript_12985/m.11490 type:complete len:80 (+) Transcript_12985:371-610(+)